jgi:lysyl-tRNA synthetase class 2
MSRWFQIESLYRFNAKFRPEWEPRYVCYPAARDLPRIGIAALEAEAFIARPSMPRFLRRKTRTPRVSVDVPNAEQLSVEHPSADRSHQPV